MPDVNDPRPRITSTQTVPGQGLASAVAHSINELFLKAAEEAEWRRDKQLDLTTIRISVLSDTQIQASARVGVLPDPDECPSCHTHAGHAHTDYCQRARLSSLLDPATCQHEEVDSTSICRGCGIGIQMFGRIPVVVDPNLPPNSFRIVSTTPPPVPVHRCTDPACPVHGPHAHAGTDVLMRHPDCTCHYLQAWRTWSVEPHRPGCPLPHPTPQDSWPAHDR